MKQKIGIALLCLGIVAGISLSLYMTFSEKEKVEVKPPANQEEPVKPNPTDQQIPSPIPHETNKPEPKNSGNIYEKPPEKKLRSISSNEASSYEVEARKAFRNFEFMKGVEHLQSIVNEVESKNAGEILHQLYFEGSMIANLVPHTEEEEMSGDHGEPIEFDGMVGILSSIKDPENALLGTLVVNDRYRAEIILEQDSLNPIFDGGVRILNKSTETEGTIHNEVINMYPNAKTLHKIDFEIEGYHLIGYVIEFADGYSKLYSILPAEGVKPPYKTINQWRKIYEAIEKR